MESVKQSKRGKEKWANLTPEQRKQWTDNINESHHCDGQGFIDYWADHNEKMLAHTVNAIQNHKGGISVTERIDMKISQSPCVLLKAHAIIMKDDPERLTTDFLQNLIGRKCRTNVKNETHLQQTEPKENASD